MLGLLEALQGSVFSFALSSMKEVEAESIYEGGS